MTEGHELGARSAGEVIDVDAAVDLAVHCAYRGGHRVNPEFAVRVGVHDLAGELDQLAIFWSQFLARYVHGSHGSDS